jgi:hypothetical protein
MSDGAREAGDDWGQGWSADDPTSQPETLVARTFGTIPNLAALVLGVLMGVGGFALALEPEPLGNVGFFVFAFAPAIFIVVVILPALVLRQERTEITLVRLLVAPLLGGAVVVLAVWVLTVVAMLFPGVYALAEGAGSLWVEGGASTWVQALVLNPLLLMLGGLGAYVVVVLFVVLPVLSFTRPEVVLTGTAWADADEERKARIAPLVFCGLPAVLAVAGLIAWANM